MLDIGFSELVVIGVVALIVIGPERLPRVARTAGHLLGRFQRYVADVKADINREMELAELKNLQSSVEDAARSIEHSVKTGVEDAQKEFRDAQAALAGTGAELKKAEDELKQAVFEMPTPHMGTAVPGPEHGEPSDGSSPQAGVPPVLPPATDGPSPLPVMPRTQSPPAAEEGVQRGENGNPSPQLELGLDTGLEPTTRGQT
jgi:sec-independent protein translocase protein TatB